ncbi:MAG: acyltransferase family protein, partial [Thiotrichales bacterium]|nr:acyltransferase family protein [Thiotrichales bacterium]
MSNVIKSQRYHGLDAFRATMMLLGLVFHSAVNFTYIPVSRGWPYRDANASYFFDALTHGLHLFRMPAFFVIAGFFAALVFYKRGLNSLLLNRLQRVTLPLFVLWLFIAPATCAGFTFALSMDSGVQGALSAVFAYLKTGTCLLEGNLTHLWFLYFLTIFYLATGILVILFKSLNSSIREKLNNLFRSINLHPAGIIPVIIITALTLLPMNHAGFETNTTLTPPITGLIAYFIFFIYGWILYFSDDLLQTFSERTWPHLITGSIFCTVYCYLLIIEPESSLENFHFIAVVTGSIGMWNLIYGLLGLFC